MLCTATPTSIWVSDTAPWSHQGTSILSLHPTLQGPILALCLGKENKAEEPHPPPPTGPTSSEVGSHGYLWPLTSWGESLHLIFTNEKTDSEEEIWCT